MAVKIDYRETLVTYLNSTDIDEAAKNLKITKVALLGRIRLMRKVGVKVPLARRGTGLDSLMIAQLNSIIIKHNAEMKK